MAERRKILYMISANYPCTERLQQAGFRFKTFCCGILVDFSGKVVKAAPIIGYIKGWEIKQVYEYCKKRRFTIEKIF